MMFMMRTILRLITTKTPFYLFNFILDIACFFWLKFNNFVSIFVTTNTNIFYDDELNGFWIGNSINPKKIILYFHGGARVSGKALMHIDALNQIVTDNKKIAIFAYEYPLINFKTKISYLQQIEACVDVYNKLIVKINPSNLIVMGESAGGTLALNLCSKIEKHIQPSKLILISPWVDILDIKYKVDDIITTEYIEYCSKTIKKFNDDKCQDNDYFLSPILIPTNILKTFPKILLFVGSEELFYNQIERFRAKFSTKIENYICCKSVHIYPLMRYYDKKLADDSLKIIAEYCYHHLDQ